MYNLTTNILISAVTAGLAVVILGFIVLTFKVVTTVKLRLRRWLQSAIARRAA